MSKFTIKRWEPVDGQIFAKAVFDTVGGDCIFLTQKNDSEILNKIALAIGNRFKHKVDRFWAFTYYHNNHLRVKEIHRNLCQKNNVTYNAAKEVSVSLSKDAGKVHCVCMASEAIATEASMICCDQCDSWHHGVQFFDNIFELNSILRV